MCRNIRPLFNYEPPSTPDDAQAAALQYIRKVSGSQRPSQANQAAFDRAVAAVADATNRLLESLVTTAQPRDRAREIERARQRRRDQR